MENVEKIADDLYFVKAVHPEETFVGITVVLGKQKIGLVDTGFEETIVDHLFPFLREIGRRPEEIDLVVNTHGDRDKVQGNKVIKEKTKAKIAIHELDAEAVEVVDIKLKDGDYVDLGDRKFQVIHTPGHTPGSMCLYNKITSWLYIFQEIFPDVYGLMKKEPLIVGDSLLGDRVDLIRMDKNIYIKSVIRLLDLDVRLLIQSHPRKPFGKAILVGEEPREMMLTSLYLAEKSMRGGDFRMLR